MTSTPPQAAREQLLQRAGHVINTTATWWRVGPGDGRAGQVGQQIGVIALKHAPGYEIVMHMQSGRVDTFAPHGLYPYQTPHPAAHKES